MAPYFQARLLHAVSAAIITALLLGPASFIPASLFKVLPALGSGQYLNGSFGPGSWHQPAGHQFPADFGHSPQHHLAV